MLYVAAAQSSSHYPGETTIQIDPYLAREFIPTQTLAHPAKVASGHLWYNLGLTRVSNQCRTLRDSTNLPRRSGPSPTFGLMPLALRTSLLPPVCALSLIGDRPELSYSASRSYHQIRPTKCKACVQPDMRTYSELVLNRHRWG